MASAQQTRSESHRAAYLKWHDVPPGMPADLADEFMKRLTEGSTLRKLTSGSKGCAPALVTPQRFKKHCELHPEWAVEAMRLAKANAKAADRLKSVNSFWRKRTQELCLKGLHPMVGDNLRIDPSTGRRACLACRKIAAKNPPPMKPAMIALVKRELDRGISLSQMTFGRPTGGGAVNPSLKIVDPAVFYHQRRIDPEFDRYIVERIANNSSRGQRIRYARARARVQSAERREEANDYEKILALFPISFPGREDAAQDVFVALFDKSLRREDVRARVKQFIAGHNRMFPTNFAKFGDSPLVSLDEALFEDGSGTRGENVSRGLWD
ncbi:hypothetical protein [Bradyrhizobium sp. cf659]|uniref:hypothetical protein n=1 Tax=Bradyrhizobium sp. cf659 TaxID=1761771 RepID=UPI0008E2718E|nr:hypothetical protein [Bradyrhizobium sp. cf659]SFH82215.1 hypothetical protein SAMN04487925_101651 [Bradyrhizobium sp. cf659]